MRSPVQRKNAADGTCGEQGNESSILDCMDKIESGVKFGGYDSERHGYRDGKKNAGG